MRKKIKLLVVFCLLTFNVFSQNSMKEFHSDLNLDGVEDLFIQDRVINFDRDEDVLRITINITIKILNKDGTVKNEMHFIEKRDFYDDEYDGTLNYKIDNNKIVRNLIIGRGSYKNYIDSFFVYDKSSDNWKLERRKTVESPQHENKITEKQFKNEHIFLFDKTTGVYSGEDY